MTIPEVYAAVVDLALALGAAPLHQHPACWECQVDGRWRVSINGHRAPRQTTTGITVPPFEVAVEFNGWPAGIVGPTGGVLAAGEAANEAALIAAVRAKSAARTEARA